MNDYLSVVYDSARRPYTDYPAKMTKYLFDTYGMKAGQTMLEPGCGRGEMLRCFKNLGLTVQGMDLSPEAADLIPDMPVDTGDVENEGLPYPDNSFDIIYSKSFLEHFHYPERYMKEAFRTLKPGGLILSLVPDWEANHQKYFDDFTHRTPFTTVSLLDIHKVHGFEQVNVVKFRQLPLVWRYPMLNYLCAVAAPFVPVRTKNKMRWVREIMLIGSAVKPASSGEVK